MEMPIEEKTMSVEEKALLLKQFQETLDSMSIYQKIDFDFWLTLTPEQIEERKDWFMKYNYFYCYFLYYKRLYIAPESELGKWSTEQTNLFMDANKGCDNIMSRNKDIYRVWKNTHQLF